MGNCIAKEYPKLSHTDDDSITPGKPVLAMKYMDPTAEPSRDNPDVAIAIKDLPDGADLKTLSSLAAGSLRKHSNGGISLLSDMTATPDKSKLPVRVASLGSLASPPTNPTRITQAKSHSSIRDIQASSHETIRQTKDNLDLLRQIQAMHDEAVRNDSGQDGHGNLSRKTSTSSAGHNSDRRSNSSLVLYPPSGHIVSPRRNSHPQEKLPPPSPQKNKPIYVMNSRGDLHRADHEVSIPLLSDRGEEATEGIKPSFCLSSPRSSCPVIDHTRDSFALSPYSQSNGRDSQSFSMSPHTFDNHTRPTALSLESYRYTQSFSDYVDRDTTFSSYADRDTRTSMSSEPGLYL